MRAEKSGYIFLIVAGLISVLFFVFKAYLPNEEVSKQKQAESSRYTPGNFTEKRNWLSWSRGGDGSGWKEIERKNLISRRQTRNNFRGKLANSTKSEMVSVAGIEGRWVELGSQNQSGRMLGVDFNDRTGELIAISDGGQVWLYDAEKKWHSLNDSFRLRSPYTVQWIKNTDYSRIVASSRDPGEVYYSDDRGFTWSKSSGITHSQSVNLESELIHIWQSADEVHILKRINQQLVIYSSSDGGDNFSRSTSLSAVQGSFFARAWHDPLNGKLYVISKGVGTNLKLYEVSKDAVAELAVPKFEHETEMVNITGSQGYLYLAYSFSAEDSNKTQFFSSSNLGRSWNARGEVEDQGLSFSVTSFAVAADDPRVLYFGGIEAFVSRDGGSQWRKVNDSFDFFNLNPKDYLHADITNFYSGSIAGKGYTYISTDGGLYLSMDQLLTVENISLNGLNVSQYYDVYTAEYNPHQILAGSQDQGMQAPLTHGKQNVKFKQLESGDVMLLKSGDQGRSMWSQYAFFTEYRSTMETYPNQDYESFVRAGWAIENIESIGGAGFSPWVSPFIVAPNEPNSIITGVSTQEASHLWKVTVDLESAEVSEVKVPFDFSEGGGNVIISEISMSTLNPDYQYVVTSSFSNEQNSVFTSTNGGKQWTKSSFSGGEQPSSARNLKAITLLPSSVQQGRFYFAGSQYSTGESIFVSEDNGKTFTAMTSGLPNTTVRGLAESTDGELIFAATESGPYVYSRNNGRWESMHGLYAPEQVYTAVEYVDDLNLVRFATYGRGIWDFHFSDDSMVYPRVNGSYSGMYYEPAHNGEGLFLQVLNGERAIVSWFTYDAEGNQSWLLSSDGKIEGDSIMFNDMFITSGDGFGPEFNAGSVKNKPWGQMSLTFQSCSDMWMSYSGPDSYGRGYQNHIKLAGINGLDCQNEPTNSSGRGLWTGTYYNEDRSGEGIFLQEVSDELAVVTFFGYDNNQQQMWLIAEGTINEDRIVFEKVRQPINGIFGPQFDPATIDSQAWGSLLIEGSACGSISLRFEAIDQTVTTLNMAPLSKPQGLRCE